MCSTRPWSTRRRPHGYALDHHVGGRGRDQPWDEREQRITAKVEQLVAAGGAVIKEYRERDGLDHVVTTDPEGNEFCVV